HNLGYTVCLDTQVSYPTPIKETQGATPAARVKKSTFLHERQQIWAYEVIASGKRGGTDHIPSLRTDGGKSGALHPESRCRALSGTGAEARGLGREPAAIRNQQSGGPDGAQATGRKCALYPGAVRTGHGLTTVRAAAMPTGWKECQEKSGGGSGSKVGGVTAPTVGDGRGL